MFTGGGADFDLEYKAFGKKVFEYAMELNDNGTFFPMWGTCLGQQNFAEFVASDPDNVISDCPSHL
jgi:hypothetical protein